MVQVLPYVPGFGEKLAEVISQAGTNIGNGLINRNVRLSDQRIIDQLANSQNLSPIQQISAFGKISPKGQQGLGPLFTHVLDQQRSKGVQQQEQQQEHQDISELINESVNELMNGNLGFFNQYNKATSKGRESRAYFDELALGIEKRLATMVGKGALSVPRFEYLKKNLPSSSNTDATNRGKLRALSKEFKSEIKNPEFVKILEGSSESQPAQSNGRFLISPSGKRVFIPEDKVEQALASGGKLE